jgi:hypothetical protein
MDKEQLARQRAEEREIEVLLLWQDGWSVERIAKARRMRIDLVTKICQRGKLSKFCIPEPEELNPLPKVKSEGARSRLLQWPYRCLECGHMVLYQPCKICEARRRQNIVSLARICKAEADAAELATAPEFAEAAEVVREEAERARLDNKNQTFDEK